MTKLITAGGGAPSSASWIPTRSPWPSVSVVDLMVDVEAMIDSRLAERGDDLISGLLDAEEAGDRLTHDEVVTMVGNLIVGGHDTNSGATRSWPTYLSTPTTSSGARSSVAAPPISPSQSRSGSDLERDSVTLAGGGRPRVRQLRVGWRCG